MTTRAQAGGLFLSLLAVSVAVPGAARENSPQDAAAYAQGYQAALLSGDRGNALANAAGNGRLDAVRFLLSKGTDANLRDSQGVSALARACAGGYPDVAEALLDAGARFDQLEKNGSTPVLIALFAGHPDVARMLIKRGAQLNAKANGGSSALNRAIGSGQLEMVQSALNLGADPNETDANGQTPVHSATYANRPDMVKALVAAGGLKVGVLGRVGLSLGLDAKGTIIVKAVLPGSPAQAAGLRKDDKIVSIDGTDALRYTLAQATAHLRGAPGTKVEIGASRGGDAPVVYTVVRQAVGGETGPAETAAAPPAAAAPKTSDIDSPGENGAERPNDFALVIGIEDYESVPKADYAVRDARAVRKHLLALGWPERNVVLLEDQAATESKLKSYLQEWLPLNVKEDSTLFVYFSGHGAPDPVKGDAYLVPWDGDPRFLKSTAYPLKQMYGELSRLKAKRVIVALDSCFSGGGGRSVLAKGARPLVVVMPHDVPQGENLTVLSAAGGDQITGTLDDQGHGAFTYYLLKGLSGAAKNARGEVTAKGLFDYLKPRVEDEGRRQNRVQTPTFVGAESGVPLATY